MVLECSLDCLVKEVRGEKLVDVSVGEPHCERLQHISKNGVKNGCTGSVPENRGQFHGHTTMNLGPHFQEGQQSDLVSEDLHSGCQGRPDQHHNCPISRALQSYNCAHLGHQP